MTADERVRDVLREHGLRGTSQRLAILQLLRDAGRAAHGPQHAAPSDAHGAAHHDTADHDTPDHAHRHAPLDHAPLDHDPVDHEHGSPHGHLTVAEIHTRLASRGTQLDVTTIYRTLTTLVELGIVHAVADAAGATAYGLATRAHHHAVCRRCGTVTGIPDDALAPTLGVVAGATGFDRAGMTLTVHGLCAGCRNGH